MSRRDLAHVMTALADAAQPLEESGRQLIEELGAVGVSDHTDSRHRSIVVEFIKADELLTIWKELLSNMGYGRPKEGNSQPCCQG